MEPQQARLTLLVFMAFSVAIVFNALFLQKDAGFSTGPARANASAGDLSGTRMSDENTERHTLLRALRRELAAHNYFPGHTSSHLDGDLDAMMIGAIMAYQYDSGLEVNGLATDALLKSFFFGVDKSVRPARQQGELPLTNAGSHQLVAEIQGILSAKGHYGGAIDGIFTARTMAAVKRFESDRGLPVTGRISGLLVQELTRSTGVVFSVPQ